ncbi:hypothetical protein [Paraflavitalea pollutisoli]|uniref:hypothetical protein n=1 Tax=Paraflavitalea pollutisoli TaxID=3034143 RepID=UPI0023EA9656|nr:hypothetical protein [Paraflavitalea sp. H1-2-19X]
MKKLLPALCLTAIVLLSGCLSAFNPLFTEKDIVYDARLLGSWKKGADGPVYSFEQGNAQSFAELPTGIRDLASRGYLLTIKEGADDYPSRFFVFMSRIGKHLYLDYFPSEAQHGKSYAAFYTRNYIPLHSFFRVQLANNGESMTIMRLKESFLEDLVRNKQIRIRRETRMDGTTVITAPTEDLRQYVRKYGELDAAYDDRETYTSIK